MGRYTGYRFQALVLRRDYMKKMLNVWESDGAGIQLGIGARGLSPNRTSNFNTRQNGYDISADALGYPESYYTPLADGLEKIEIIRGAAALQFGTQFGGVINFIMKSPYASEEKPIRLLSKNTLGCPFRKPWRWPIEQ